MLIACIVVTLRYVTACNVIRTQSRVAASGAHALLRRTALDN
jgi:hypothetical protein